MKDSLCVDISELAGFGKEDTPYFLCKIANFTNEKKESVAESDDGSVFLVCEECFYYPIARPINEKDMAFVAERHPAPYLLPGNEIVVMKHAFGSDDRIATMWSMRDAWNIALDIYEKFLFQTHDIIPF